MLLVRSILKLGIEKYINEEKNRDNRKRPNKGQKLRLKLKPKGKEINNNGKIYVMCKLPSHTKIHRLVKFNDCANRINIT